VTGSAVWRAFAVLAALGARILASATQGSPRRSVKDGDLDWADVRAAVDLTAIAPPTR
jgi:hypothetical protein